MGTIRIKRGGYMPNSTSFPKGARESLASLKCCLPKGMPMMMM